MWSIAIKNLRANLSRFVATLIAIATGVGFLTAGTMITNSIENSLGGEVDRQYEAVATAIEPAGRFDDEGGVRATMDADVLDDITDVDGVRAATGELAGTTRLIVDGQNVEDDAFAEGPAVRLWIKDDSLNPIDLVEGRAPAAPNEVTVDRTYGEDNDISLNDSITLSTVSGAQKAKVVGITIFGTTSAPDFEGTITAAAPWAFGLAGYDTEKFSRIIVAADEGVSDATLTERIREVIPDGARAVTGQQFREDAKADTADVLSILRPVLQGFSGLAIFVCCFVIYNTFRVVVGQRVRELALMRAIAATPRQIRRSLQVEGLGIGLIGSILGLGLGALLTFVLSRVLVALELNLPRAQIVLTPGIVAAGLLIGTVTTFISVLIPSFRAGRTAPVEAMREAAVEPTKASKRRWITAVVMLALGAAGMFTRNGWLLAFGSLVFIIGVFVGGPGLATAFTIPARRVMRMFGIAGRLSTDNIARNPNRTSTTTNALVIGLLLVTMVTLAGNSLKKTSVETVNRFSSSDFLIGSTTGKIDSGLLDKIEAIDGVSAMVRLRSLPVTTDGHPDALTSADPKDLARVGIKPADGSPPLSEIGDGVASMDFGGAGGGGGEGGPGGSSIGAERVFTDQNGKVIRLKTTVLLEFSIDALTLGSLVSPETLAKYAPDAAEGGALLRVDSDKLDQVNKELRSLTVGFGNVQVAEGNIFGQAIEAIFSFLINAVNGLLGMSVVIALIGIVNTLTLSIFERRRELGLLRAIGMTTREVRRMIRLEALQVAFLGTVVGMAAGTVLAWLLLRASDFSSLDLVWGKLGIVFGIGILIGVVAAIAPTRRVTKLDILDSMAVT